MNIVEGKKTYPFLSAVVFFDVDAIVVGFATETTGLSRGHISFSISAMHPSKCRKRRVLHALSLRFGVDGSGGGSGIDKYRATSRAQSE